MNLTDVGILALMLVGFINGVMKGFVQQVFTVLALVAGVIAGGRMAAGTSSITGELSHPTAGKVFVFMITFVVVAIVVHMIGKTVANLTKAAHLGVPNRILGGVVGVVLVALAVGIVLRLLESMGFASASVEQSTVARHVMSAISYFLRFIPQAGSPPATTVPGVWGGGQA